MSALLPPGAADAVRPLRILAISQLWQGANDYAFVRAFRRMGHDVEVVSLSQFLPRVASPLLRGVLRVLREPLTTEYNRAIVALARTSTPDLFFGFKGPMVRPETIDAVKATGAIAIQFYPDVSFHTHGPYMAGTLGRYDWVFTTKTFGIDDMREQLGVTDASVLLHGFDPETHLPRPPSARERAELTCDASFIGNWSPKKERVLTHLRAALPDVELAIWGPPRWDGVPRPLRDAYRGAPVLGRRYAQAIACSKINIALLSEERAGSSRGDQVTSRTFHIPAAGGFMLHERTDETLALFEEGRECAFFSDPAELAAKIGHYLAHDDERRAIAAAGREKCVTAGYSIDDRARTVLAKYHELRAARSAAPAASAAAARPERIPT